ncbi:hypothetical protein [Lacipirellula parvula]|uniref:DUF695 domain-containing protein n=1 Tax=Lacipirellula parvula TaxID=2650471 RepID=A0A5K7XES8_9BACT|nr:hypothetical protein [Lacipirellula parvula]BBO35384.1 hypothetical protein PLANPX_4996 [Lacipirellula parvula]
MRWKFRNKNDEQETATRNAWLQRIDAWWAEFGRQNKAIDAYFNGRGQFDLPTWMSEHLHAIDDRIMWEYGPADAGEGHRLVLTCESRHHQRPLIDVVLARAPKLPGWEFHPYRPAAEAADAIEIVQSRVGVDISDYQLQVRRNEYHQVDLCFYSTSIPNDEDDAAHHAAFVATEAILGEKQLGKWVGAIEAKSLKKGWASKLLGRESAAPKGLIALARMRPTVAALIASIREQLPATPRVALSDDLEYTLWKLQPTPADDYAGRQDLLTATSSYAPMWQATHGRSFFSERFSRVGEIFCYVKIDGAEGLDESSFGDRDEIEDALDEALQAAQAGCVIGAGTGLLYSYIELALTDVNAGILAVRRRLREGNIPRRTWVQFYDATLAAEWVGIYDETPAPPMPAEFDEA